MQIFTVDNNEDVKELADRFHFDLSDIQFQCEYYETRNSWGHKAVAIDVPTSTILAKNKFRYYNRTWECYTYQSILKNLVRKTCTELTNGQIDYEHVLSNLSDEELKDINELTQKDFMKKYTWANRKDIVNTKAHYKRIGVI